jgi:hypothetical protein
MLTEDFAGGFCIELHRSNRSYVLQEYVTSWWRKPRWVTLGSYDHEPDAHTARHNVETLPTSAQVWP